VAEKYAILRITTLAGCRTFVTAKSIVFSLIKPVSPNLPIIMKTKTTLFTAVGLLIAFSFTAGQTAHAQCRDPWINQAYRELGKTPAGQGEAGQCNIKFYNNGTWGSYPELKRYVQEFQSCGITVGHAMLPNGHSVMAIKAPSFGTAVNVLDAAGNIFAEGAAKAAAAGASKLIGNDSGGLVGQDGSTIMVDQNAPGFIFSGNFGTLSGRRIKTSGRGGIRVR